MVRRLFSRHSEESRCPPKRGLAWCCVFNLPWLIVAWRRKLQVMLDSVRDEYIYIYPSQDHGGISFSSSSPTAANHTSFNTPATSSLPESSRVFPTHLNLSFNQSHPSCLVTRTAPPCLRIAPPTATTTSKIALLLAQNAPLRAPFTVTTLIWVPMPSLPPFLPFSLSFSSFKASNGRPGLT